MDAVEGAENIRFTKENVDLNVDDAVKVRSRSTSTFDGLGPPDLCYLTKVRTRIARPIAIGYFHFVLGLDVSSAAPVALYFKHLLENQEQVGFFGSADLYYQITSFQYCSYNAFRRADLNIEIFLNGKMKVYSIDSKGVRDEKVSEDFWEETYFCALLRSLTPQAPKVPCLKMKSLLVSAADDETLCRLAKKYFAQGYLLSFPLSSSSSALVSPRNSKDNSIVPSSSASSSSSKTVSAENGSGNGSGSGAEVDLSSNPLTMTMVHYLLQTNRFETLERFLGDVLSHDPKLCRFVALCQHRAGNTSAALETIQKFLAVEENCLPLMIVQAELLFIQKRFPETIKYCDQIVKLFPKSQRTAYYLQAESLMAQRGAENYKRAIRTLIAATNDSVHESINESILLRPIVCHQSSFGVSQSYSLHHPTRSRASSLLLLPPYSRQTTPSDLNTSLLVIDQQEEEAFMSEEVVRKFAFYRLSASQREIYRILSNAERTDGAVITKMWHEVENEAHPQRPLHMGPMHKSAPAANSILPPRNQPQQQTGAASSSASASGSGSPSSSADIQSDAAEFEEIGLNDEDDRKRKLQQATAKKPPSLAAKPIPQQNPLPTPVIEPISPHATSPLPPVSSPSSKSGTGPSISGTVADSGKVNFGTAFRAFVDELKQWDQLQKEKIETFQPSDWVGAGLLALRLKYFIEAQTLLDESAKANEAHALKALLEMYSLKGDAKQLILSANQLCDHYREEFQILNDLHPKVLKAFAEIVAKIGLKEFSDIFEKTAVDFERDRMNQLNRPDQNGCFLQLRLLLQKLSQWRSFGFDR